MNAPVVLFVYNRPWHTQQTLEALMKNEIADESILYIYCDGPKPNTSIEQLKNINKVRSIVKTKQWCKEVNIIERDDNLGLANSVILGVSDIINKHKKVIVLEDDIVTGKYFLKFMNRGLEIYESHSKVYGISGYCFPYEGKIKKETFFLPIMSSWGYATWIDRWNKINFDGKYLLNKILENKLENKMNFIHLDFFKMLKEQVSGKNDSWAVRFYAFMFLNKVFFLYPKLSLLKNIGLDGSGVHCEIDNENKKKVIDIDRILKIKKDTVKLDKKIVNKFDVNNQTNKMKRLKKNLKKIIAPELIEFLKRKNLFFKKNEDQILKEIPRYTETKVRLKNREIVIPDSASYLFMKKEIFYDHIYNFQCSNNEPYIIDGGANIGLASIYLKLKYPKSEILAFEPDNKIFDILKKNIKSFGFEDIKVIKKGIWKNDTTLFFKSEGADGGLLSDLNKNTTSDYSVEVVSLKPYLNKKVDFLKLDIEGAETTVLLDIKDHLDMVDRIFLEYHSFVGQKQTLNEIVDILTKANFRLHISSPGLSSKSPFINITEYNNMDMQLNIYAIRE